MDSPVTHRELEQFKALMESENNRLQEENSRQNHRIEELEETARQLGVLTTSVEKLASSMESMVKEQEKQGKRLEVLEGRDGEKWRNIVSHIITTVVGAVVCYLLMQHGM